ncbi:type II secretion system F family protein [Marinobacterium arenosum]|uniref:type II secretion system F family protein n=1 Tax=Marinobacterium arenosum TaxID=2862496 RepID=UPI001C96C1CD|nr:type II secretion system F family protein [Marinobacterium arenosum]MBY4678549.1 type II secretion system F family protein [Marinobacterium arenosum]
MAQFYYRAVTADGEEKSGQLEAADQNAVVATLHDRGMIPLSIDTEPERSWLNTDIGAQLGRKRIGDKQVITFSQQLAYLLEAGIPLDRALEIMLQVTDDPAIRTLVQPIRDGVQRGQALSGVLAEQPGVFSQFYISMVQAAEASGSMGAGLNDLVAYLESSRALRDKLVSALIYPIILLLVSAFSLLIILTYVVPQFETLFADMGKALPLPTQIVLGMAEGVKNYGPYALIALLLLLFYFKYLLRDAQFRYRWHGLQLRMPLFGTLRQRVETARLSRSLGTLLRGGVPMLGALRIARETLTNSVMAEAVDEAALSLKEGRHLAEPLLATGLFPSLAMQMIQVGEETGRLDEMLLKVSEVYDREVATAIQRLLTILEPALIVGLGVFIAGIIMSILVAIMSINEIPL